MRIAPALLASVFAAGCSFYDFLGYEENTGLHVIDRPDGYGSAQFGVEIASTSTPETELVAASAGAGYGTIFYRVAAGGDLADDEEPWKKYLGDGDEEKSASDWRSGASLAGLPLFDDRQGCVAIGEPAASRVVVVCEPGVKKFSLKPPTVGDSIMQNTDLFGQQVASVRGVAGGPWLLAVAAENEIVVMNGAAASERSDVFLPYGIKAGDVYELAAGRVRLDGAGGADGLIFVAATTYDSKAKIFQTYLFVQNGDHQRGFEQRVCLERLDSPGYGGVMATGDLDRDGSDELVVGSARATDAKNTVHVFSVRDLLFDANGAYVDCVGERPEPMLVIEPGEGPLDVTCEEGCAFGAALAVGDIATDDDGPELMIGAPLAEVDGASGAGAVYVFRGFKGEAVADGRPELAGQVADSYPEHGDEFGGGLAVAPMAGRNELVVGATGRGQVIIAFCTGVGKEGAGLEDGADITEDAEGDLSSSRCRP